MKLHWAVVTGLCALLLACASEVSEEPEASSERGPSGCMSAAECGPGQRARRVSASRSRSENAIPTTQTGAHPTKPPL